MGDETKNEIQLLVDRRNLTAQFKTTGDIWEWLKASSEGRGRHADFMADNVFAKAKDGECERFYYESDLDRFIDNYRKYVDAVVFV